MGKKVHSVLFVDDDPLILKGLQRSVDEFSDYWDVDFASSGYEALIKLGERSFDAIVTDMCMPVMDGIQLLGLVNQKSPNVMRFVLSGNTSDTQILQSTHLAHQMFPKPCDIGQIFLVIDRACRLRDMLVNPQLLHIITGIRTLPSVPVVYNWLVKELQSENASSQAVGDIIAKDTAMTAKILQLVNSAFFGLSDNVSSPQRAVTLLGLNTIKALVLGIQIFSEYQNPPNSLISIDAIWEHSLSVSNLAFVLAKDLKLSNNEQEDARVAGILHDIGKLLELKIPNIFLQVKVDRNGRIPFELEYQVWGTSHAEMGAYLLGIWGLPDTIVETVAFHHRPGLQALKHVNLLTALHSANGLLNMCSDGKEGNYSAYLDMAYLQNSGVVDRLEEWTIITKNFISQTDKFVC